MRFAAATALVILATSSPVPAQAGEDPDRAKASALFVSALRDRCADHAFDGREKTPERYDIAYRDPGALPGEPDKKLVLFEFFCDNFAHSGSAVFIQKESDGAFSIVSFAKPFNVMAPDPANDGNLSETGLSGLVAQDTLLNAEFDAATLTMSTSDHVGNVEYFSTWRLVGGLFLFSGDQSWTVWDGKLVRTSALGEE